MDATTADAPGDAPPLLSYRDLRSARACHTAKAQRKRTLNHRVRLAAKQFHQQHPTETPCQTLGITCHINPSRAHLPPKRSHAEWDFRGEEQAQAAGRAFRSARGTLSSSSSKGRDVGGGRAVFTLKSGLVEEADEHLADAPIVFPCDRYRNPQQRHPSLEREDAFCDATTYKGKVRVQRMMPEGAYTGGDDDDAQLAELYRMGLLYDGKDKKQRADAAFGLNNIHHDEPVYTIRPARRNRKSHRASAAHRFNGTLPLDLSFSDLGNDNDLNQYFNPSPDAEDMDLDDATTPDEEEDEYHHSRRSSAPLRVIYELATSRPSFDMDTSQPPDLMIDSLSDYDYFSDSELDDSNGLPSQRVVHEEDNDDDAVAATSASGPWVLLGDDS